MRYESGVEFGGRYSLTDRIAVGGMGEVWRARDKVLARPVAIKLLSPTLAGQPGFAQRFREEARNSAALGHPNIAGVYDYGEDAGANWLVMELVEGENLAQIIRDQGTIAPQQASSIISQAALALQAAHDGGVIHRDVKPANIIIRPDGVVKLTDFGISRATDAVPITRTGEVMGTAQYISPEQATGQSVGPASDVYALGVVAYEMVTGRRPFDESTPVATAMAHVQDPPPPLPRDVPKPLSTVIMASLKKEPGDRPASAGEVARILTGGASAANLLTTQKLTNPMATRRMASTAPQPKARPVAPAADPRDVRRLDPDDDERPSSKAWIWVLIAALLIGGGIWAAVASGLFDGSGEPTTPATPGTGTVSTGSEISINPSDYIGRPISEVNPALAQLGLLTNVTEVASDLPAGTVLRITTPGPYKRNDVLSLEVSQGPSTPTSTPPTVPPTTDAPQEPSEPAQQETPAQQPSTPLDEPAQQPATQDTPAAEPTAPATQGGAAPAPGVGGSDAEAAAGRVGPVPAPAAGDDSAKPLGDSAGATENTHNGGHSAQTYRSGAGSASATGDSMRPTRIDWTVQIP
ncbi:MAG: protein kinase [Dermatophilus congolensis]|nr:protein kinase [Dermatophilus congolensis]